MVSGLVKHQIYFFQSELGGVSWMMPISEQDCWDGKYIDVITSIYYSSILPKIDNIKGYMVEIETGRYTRQNGKRVKETIWEIPKDKYGLERKYKHYTIRADVFEDSIIIPFQDVMNDYEELTIKSGLNIIPMGISKSNETKIKREILLKNILK